MGLERAQRSMRLHHPAAHGKLVVTYLHLVDVAPDERGVIDSHDRHLCQKAPTAGCKSDWDASSTLASSRLLTVSVVTLELSAVERMIKRRAKKSSVVRWVMPSPLPPLTEET